MGGNNKVAPLKIEKANGNDPFDLLPTEANPAEDLVMAKGVLLGAGEETRIEESAGNLEFEDQFVGPLTLSELLEGATEESLVGVSVIVAGGQILIQSKDLLTDEQLNTLTEVEV